MRSLPRRVCPAKKSTFSYFRAIRPIGYTIRLRAKLEAEVCRVAAMAADSRACAVYCRASRRHARRLSSCGAAQYPRRGNFF